MDISQIIEWLKEYKDAVASLGIIVSGVWAVWIWKKKQMGASTPAIANQYSSQGNQINVPITATNGGSVNGVHIGDTHHHGLSMDDAMKLAAKLAAEKGEKDAQVIKSLQETIQALTRQNAQKYDIQQAFDLLAQGNTAKAEEIFANIADEAKRKGKEANIKEAEALRHLGSLAYLHDTQKAFAAYRRSIELDPENLIGWHYLGLLYQRIGELENAENAFKTILVLSGSDKKIQALVYNNLGIVYKTRGKLEEAIGYYEKSLAHGCESGFKESMADAYGNLGNVYKILGNLDLASKNYHKALAIDEELDRKEGMANQYCNLGVIYKNQGKLSQALDYCNKALTIYEALGHKEGMANVNGNLANVYAIRDEHDLAIKYYRKALAINEELGYKEGIANQHGNLGIVYEHQGEFDLAIDNYHKALVINQEIGRKEGIASVYLNLGLVCLKKQTLVRARKYLTKSLTRFEELGHKQGIAASYGNLGKVCEAFGDLARAEENYHKALEIDIKLDNSLGIATGYSSLGDIYMIRSEPKRAIKYWKQSLVLFQQLGAKDKVAWVQSLIDGAEQKNSN